MKLLCIGLRLNHNDKLSLCYYHVDENNEIDYDKDMIVEPRSGVTLNRVGRIYDAYYGGRKLYTGHSTEFYHDAQAIEEWELEQKEDVKAANLKTQPAIKQWVCAGIYKIGKGWELFYHPVHKRIPDLSIQKSFPATRADKNRVGIIYDALSSENGELNLRNSPKGYVRGDYMVQWKERQKEQLKLYPYLK